MTWRLARGLRASGVVLALCEALGWACSSDPRFGPVRAVEAPPPRYASGPTRTGATHEVSFPTPEAVQAFCDRWLGRPERGYYQACYVPALDLVVLPDAHAWPSARERAELRAHEWAHARGWRHQSLILAADLRRPEEAGQGVGAGVPPAAASARSSTR